MISVIALWNAGCPHREAAWEWVRQRYEEAFPRWPIVIGESHDPRGYSRTQAILDGASKTDADTLVITDADVWCDGLREAAVWAQVAGWAVPHRLVHRLSCDGTAAVLGGAPWRAQPLSSDNPQDRRPYLGHEAGTLLVIARAALAAAPPDPRFVGWGQEDDAWAFALRSIVGPPRRGSHDLVHLWHPPQPRQSRVIGNDDGRRLLRRYRNAARSPSHMQALVEEARQWTSPSFAPSPPASTAMATL